MPNLITHALFADDVLERLNNPLCNAKRKMFLTGSQGPDFLFFHHSDPFYDILKPSDIRKYGSLFHNEHVNDFYLSALHSIENEKNKDIQDDLIVYVCGHLCHWALDSTMHPLIYSKTGNCKGDSSWRHHQFESMLDAAMLKCRKNLTIADYDFSKECFSTSPQTARAMARIYVPAIAEIYGEHVAPSSFLEVLKDWRRIERHFRDPKDLKKKLLRPLEKMTRLEFLMTGFSIPAHYEDNVDICNLLHSPWRHPVTGEAITASVFDLMETALEKALRTIDLFETCLAHPGSPEDEQAFLDFLGDRNYEMDMPPGFVPTYFELADLDQKI